jgi:putative nucleotidyltransferase with HDIG domain
MDSIDAFLDGIKCLPPAPHVLPQLLNALNDDDTDLNRLVDLITFEPALTAKLLQTCNSAVYCGALSVNDVSDAINRLGLKVVYQIVTAAVGARTLKTSQPTYGVNAKELWKHSVIVSFAARFIAEDVGIESSLIFTAGILHDIGKVLLAEAFKHDYAQVISQVPAAGHPLFEAEKARFGVDHAEVGSRLLARWKFSPELVASVQFHHHPTAAGDQGRLAACVALGNALGNGLTQGQVADTIAQPGHEQALKILQLAVVDQIRYRERIIENMAFAEALYRMQD